MSESRRRGDLFVARTRIAAPAERVFAWHARPGALARLIPPWERVDVLSTEGGIAAGARVVVRLHVGPFAIRWTARHTHYVEGVEFVDEQESGPFSSWRHTHRVEPDGPSACVLEDRVEFRLPGGPIGNALGRPFVRAKLRRMFKHRHEVTAADVREHEKVADRAKLTVAVTGASGLVGGMLVPFLTTGGHTVHRLVRRKSPWGDVKDEIYWRPDTGEIDGARLEGVDAVVNLAGENIGEKRWSEERKALFRQSRVDGTKLLATTLAGLAKKPKVLINASAVGYYGDRGEEELDETSAPGNDFLAQMCRDWEAATKPAEDAGIRVVHLRIGLVLAARGALARMALPFKLGVGGPIGTGKQYMPWIAVDDVVGVIHSAMFDDELRGAVNTVAPEAVTNAEFSRTLGRVLKRPSFVPVPAFALRAAVGAELAEVVLGGQRVKPKRLEERAYEWRFPKLEDALRHVLGR